MVHQHFMLVPSFTVAENIILGVEPRKGIKIDMNALPHIDVFMDNGYTKEEMKMTIGWRCNNTLLDLCTCHHCAMAMLIFSASFHFERMIPEGYPKAFLFLCLQQRLSKTNLR